MAGGSKEAHRALAGRRLERLGAGKWKWCCGAGKRERRGTEKQERLRAAGKQAWRLGAGGLPKLPLLRQDGSVTLEAAIAMPVYICVVVAIAFILKCVYAHERIQHAISQASQEIAGSSYVYGLSGALDAQREAEGAAHRARDKAKDTVLKAWGLENWLPDGVSGMIGDQIDSAAQSMVEGANSAIFSQYAGSVVKKYLAGEDGQTAGLGVVGGLDGLDFAGSAYLADGSEDVVVMVAYKMRAPIFIRALSEYAFAQKACAKAWLYGEGAAPEGGGGEDAEFDIWSLGNFERGLKIREIFHANLPQSFPGISAFDSGTATLIKSLDTTAASYQSARTVSQVIGAYIDDLAGYAGQERPWGSEGIVIRNEEIRLRRLVLVIPKNGIEPEISAAIDACVQTALSRGVYMQVERYGTKHETEDGAEDRTDDGTGDVSGM
ncbi:MAG: hypothetical protein LBJ10_07560 [Clostridiales bacterium]|jgi:hypothetical protein|nr:hypothetical protein [Clostridiales bacterium]